MTGYEPRTSGIVSNHSANWASSKCSMTHGRTVVKMQYNVVGRTL